MIPRLSGAVAAVVVLSGCASGASRVSDRPKPPPPCAFATCAADAASLAKLTADQLGIASDRIEIAEAQPQFAGAVLVWRAHAAGRTYDCREGRDPRTGAVHYVDCKPSDGKAGITAFP